MKSSDDFFRCYPVKSSLLFINAPPPFSAQAHPSADKTNLPAVEFFLVQTSSGEVDPINFDIRSSKVLDRNQNANEGARSQVVREG